MPKRNRDIEPNSIQHLVNRGNDKRIIFPEPVDYGSFLALMREARERFDVQLYSYCLMPNHFHLVARVANLEAISEYMQFVEGSHAYDLRACDQTKGNGHIFQRRYWNKPVVGDGHLMSVIRYVEANPVRAGLVGWSADWEWSSMWDRVTGERDLLSELPFWLPEDWPLVVTVPQQRLDLERIRRPVRKGRPAPETIYELRKNVAGPL